ncbi:hypothetical protein BP6252_00253 [Coleophoma cylindrospora]|uniref:Rhodopsin domain-containing protein n=1 Tax=Coleophoma cylindrospora TaxID=1849047 RepID=A0A3D8SPW9_9HELO|nr:hypothetical protein BP6252_00253 [Coleophoma cylindrospora]
MAGDYRGSEVAIVAILFLALSWTFVGLRVYVRAVLTKAFGVDDWLALGALLLFSVYTAFVLDGVHYGTGRHITEVPATDFVLGMKAWWLAEIFYVSSTTVLKISIGFFLLRVCIKTYQRVIIWVVMAVMGLFSTFYFILVIVQCQPSSYFWTQYADTAGGSCLSASFISGSTYTHSAISVWADWTLGILPIFLVWGLNLNARTKVSVALILALGALGSTATAVRIPFIHQLTETQDFLYANVDVSLWSTVEPGIGITASAMATLRPLFVNFFTRSRFLNLSTGYGSKKSFTGSSTPGGAYIGSNGDVELGSNSVVKNEQFGITITTQITSEGYERRTRRTNDGVNWPLTDIDNFDKMRILGGGAWERSEPRPIGMKGTWNSSESRLTKSSCS